MWLPLLLTMEKRKIRIGIVYRILAGIISLLIIFIFVVDTENALRIFVEDKFSLLSLVFVVPVFLISAIYGKVPEYLLRKLSEEAYQDFIHSERMFSEFGPKSIGFAVVFLTMFFYWVFRNA